MRINAISAIGGLKNNLYPNPNNCFKKPYKKNQHLKEANKKFTRSMEYVVKYQGVEKENG